jgi:S-adenosylmethionine hydrolase
MANLVLLTDFGNKEHFVASMKGVAVSISPDISIFDITHEIEPHNIWDASMVLSNALPFWPSVTVFVVVVDPGVGTSRKSLACRFMQGQIIVCPDNGLLTFVLEKYNNPEIRIIDEKIHRRPGSENFQTFHGRDIYVHAGARLAAGLVNFDDMGPLIEGGIKLLDHQKARLTEDNTIEGAVMKVEQPFGNLLTDIPVSLLNELCQQQEIHALNVQIKHHNDLKFNHKIPYVKSYGYVSRFDPLAYTDSSGMIGLAVNSGSFANKYALHYGNFWKIIITID